MRSERIFLAVLLVALALTAVFAGVYAAIHASGYWVGSEIVERMILGFVFAVVLMAGSLGLADPGRRNSAILATMALSIAFFASLGMVSDWSWEEALGWVLVSLLGVSLAVMGYRVHRLAPFKSRRVAAGAVLTMLAASGLMIEAQLDSGHADWQKYLATAAMILGFATLLAQVPLGRSNRWFLLVTLGILALTCAAVIYLMMPANTITGKLNPWIGSGAIVFACCSLMMAVIVSDAMPRGDQPRLLRRTLLIALTVGGAAGAIEVFSGSGFDNTYSQFEVTIWGTAIFTVLLLITVAGWANSQMRETCWLGSGLVIAGAIMCMIKIWYIEYNGHDPEATSDIQFDLLIAAGIPALLFLRFRHQSNLKYACRFGLFACIAWFAVARVLISNYVNFITDNDWIVALAAGVAALIIACLVGAGTDRRYWRWLGIAAAIAGGGYLCASSPYSENSALYQSARNIADYLLLLAAIIAHANLIVQLPLSRGQRWLAYAMTLLMVLLSHAWIEISNIVIAPDYTRPWPLGYRLAAAGSFLYACGAVSLVLLIRLNQTGQGALKPRLNDAFLAG